MEILNNIILLLVLFIGIFVYKKYSYRSPFFIIYLVYFIYLYSVHLDFLVFDFSSVLLSRNVDVEFNSLTFTIINLLSFSFFAGYFLNLKLNEDKYKIIEISYLKIIYKPLFYLLLIIFIAYNLNEIITNFGYTRTQLRENVSLGSMLFKNFQRYFFLIIFASRIKTSNLFNIYALSFILMGILTFEREPIIVFIIAFLFKIKKRKKIFLPALLSSAILFIIANFKSFYVNFLYSSGKGYDSFIESLRNTTFSLSGLDPKMSYVIFYDSIGVYFEQFSEYRFSYVTGILNQIYRFIFESDYQTLSEYSSKIYTNNDFGTAFSFMVESILNLWFIGPFVLGFVIIYVLKYSIKISHIYGNGIIAAVIFVLIKFCRTELSTVIKLQILPLIFALFLINIFLKKYDKHMHTNI